MTKGNATWKKPARQHGKSNATWKKQRNMEKATQHGKSNATCKKQRNMEQISTATRNRQSNKDRAHDQDHAKKRRSNTKDKTKIETKIVTKNHKNGPPRWGRQRNAKQKKHTTRRTQHTTQHINISPIPTRHHPHRHKTTMIPKDKQTIPKPRPTQS